MDIEEDKEYEDFKNRYLQRPITFLTEENLDKLEDHCRKAIHYERGVEHKVSLELIERYKQVLKEINALKHINSKLRTIRVEHEWGYENINLFLKEDMTYIDKNKYFIEVEEGKIEDIKQLYLDNLNSIPKQKVKEELERAEKENEPYEEYNKESRAYWINQGIISLAKKLLEDK